MDTEFVPKNSDGTPYTPKQYRKYLKQRDERIAEAIAKTSPAAAEAYRAKSPRRIAIEMAVYNENYQAPATAQPPKRFKRGNDAEPVFVPLVSMADRETVH